MASGPSRTGVIDAVWSAAQDGEWHSLHSLAEHLRFQGEEIGAALDFLERYGFAQSCDLDEVSFRIIEGGPSPMEAADLLCSLQSAVNWRMSEWS